jgi:hypothetical protein
MTALSMVILLGFGALAVDIGFYAHTRRDIQNGADAMALAGVRELPIQADADTQARAWGTNNGIATGEITSVTFGTTCSGTSVADTITVRVNRPQNSFLAGVLGINSATMRVCATARVGVANAGEELLPFGFHRIDPYPGANPDDVCYFYETNGTTINPNLWNDQCIIKIASPSDSWGSGNAGAVRLDEGGPLTNYDGDCNPGSSGASEYEENIEEGSECWYAVGDEITPKPGNMKGPTCDGFSTRLAGNTETLAQVFGTPDANGVYGPVNRESPRFGLVPIVTVSGNGSSADITITGFITVYINGACSGAGCQGNGNNPACVVMTPVKSNIYVAGIDFAGGSLGNVENAIRTIKLIN